MAKNKKKKGFTAVRAPEKPISINIFLGGIPISRDCRREYGKNPFNY